MKDWLVPIVSTLIIAGLGTFGAAAIGARAAMRKARQDDAKLPAEVDSLWLGSAEKAVAMQQTVLDQVRAQVDYMGRLLEQERTASLAKDQRIAEKDQRIAELERQLESMRQQVMQMHGRLDEFGVRIAELKDDEEARGEVDPHG